jgi:hypothetical protein
MNNSPGDSGGAIWKNIGGLTFAERKVYGILIGITGNETVMSAMYNMEYELGNSHGISMCPAAGGNPRCPDHSWATRDSTGVSGS